MNVLNYIMVFGFVFFLACANGKTQTSNYQSISEEKLSGNIQHVFSNDSTYVLSFVEIEGTAKHPQNSIKYIVQELESGKVIREDALDNGHIGFYGDHELQVELIPGIMRDDMSPDDFTFLYDLRTGKKRTLSEAKKNN